MAVGIVQLPSFGFGYAKVANKTALDLITGQHNEIRTTSDDGLSYRYSVVDSLWYLIPSETATPLVSAPVNDPAGLQTVFGPYVHNMGVTAETAVYIENAGVTQQILDGWSSTLTDSDVTIEFDTAPSAADSVTIKVSA